MKKARWHYQGDVNPENGGFWYRLDNWGFDYADYVRITPCNDAGGPDNQFWIETGSIHSMDKPERVAQALAACGFPDQYETATKIQKRHMLACALLEYGFADVDACETVQIGKQAEHCGAGFDPISPDTVLRGGSDITRYVRRTYMSA